MSKPKHSPGPWKVDKSENFGTDRDNYCVTCEYHPNDQPLAVVAEVYGNNWSSDQERADAQLIAAAPDMLEALIHVRQTIHQAYHEESFGETCSKAMCKDLTKIITKATKGDSDE